MNLLGKTESINNAVWKRLYIFKEQKELQKERIGSVKAIDMSPSRSHKSWLSLCQINLCGLKLSRYRFSALMSPDGHFKGLIRDTRGIFGSPLVRLKTSIVVHLQKRLNEKRLHPMAVEAQILPVLGLFKVQRSFEKTQSKQR